MRPLPPPPTAAYASASSPSRAGPTVMRSLLLLRVLLLGGSASSPAGPATSSRPFPRVALSVDGGPGDGSGLRGSSISRGGGGGEPRPRRLGRRDDSKSYSKSGSKESDASTSKSDRSTSGSDRSTGKSDRKKGESDKSKSSDEKRSEKKRKKSKRRSRKSSSGSSGGEKKEKEKEKKKEKKKNKKKSKSESGVKKGSRSENSDGGPTSESRGSSSESLDRNESESESGSSSGWWTKLDDYAWLFDRPGDEEESADGPGPNGPGKGPGRPADPSPAGPDLIATLPEQDDYVVSSPDDPIPYRLRTFTPSVLDGYDDCSELEDDLIQASRFLAGSVIKLRSDYEPVGVPPAADFGSQDDNDREEDAESRDSFGTGEEEGVDHADVVKMDRDGEYLYVAYGEELLVLDAEGGRIMSRIAMPAIRDGDRDEEEEEEEGPKEAESNLDSETEIRPSPPFEHRSGAFDPKPEIKGLLLGPNYRLTVVVTGYTKLFTLDDPDRAVLSDVASTHVRVYDVSDPRSPLLLGANDIDGAYVAARSVGSTVHIVTASEADSEYRLTRHLDRMNPEYEGLGRSAYIEKARDVALGLIPEFVARLAAELTADDDGTCRDVVRISVFHIGARSADLASSAGGRPDFTRGTGVVNELVRMTSFPVSDEGFTADRDIVSRRTAVFLPTKFADVYASRRTLIVPGQGYAMDEATGRYRESTFLLSFVLPLDGSSPRGTGAGQVGGYPLDRGSMDERGGYLRVATTNRAQWACGDGGDGDGDGARVPPPDGGCEWELMADSSSQIAVLRFPGNEATDAVIELDGSVTGLGPIDALRSVQFVGTNAYVVTDMPQDPPSIADLSDPFDPRMAGELAVSGISHSLYPADGAGDVILAVGEEVDRTTGIPLGLQVALFDVSDPNAPSLLHRFREERDEDALSASAAKFDRRSFRFLRRSGLIVLPISVRTFEADGNFDGFRLYDVDVVDGIRYRFDVSHAESSAASECWSEPSVPPRSFEDGGILTTVKGRTVLGTDIDEEARRWEVRLSSDASGEVC